MKLRENFKLASVAVVGTAAGLAAPHFPLIGAAFVAAATPFAQPILSGALGAVAAVKGIKFIRARHRAKKLKKEAAKNA